MSKEKLIGAIVGVLLSVAGALGLIQLDAAKSAIGSAIGYVPAAEQAK